MAPCSNHSSFLQTILLCAYLIAAIPCTESLSHDEECLALYRFKQNFHQDYASFGFQRFDSWKITNNTSDCCLWDGVSCSHEKQESHVIGIDLSESFLYGPISSNSTLFSLLHLQMLNLSWNDFAESQIPPEIGRLKQLRGLNLSGSVFSGEIPKEVGELIQLSSLDLSWNLLKLQSLSLEKLVKNLTRLEELHLSEVHINSSVPILLANFSSLRSIMLDDCGLLNEFPTAIFHLPKLKFLDVSSNTNLTGSFPEFRRNRSLELLDVHSTGFFGIVPESIRNLNRLTYMDLGGCTFSGPIPSGLANLTRLSLLVIADNKFTSQVPSLVSLSELNVLDLSGSEFEDRHLPDWLGKLSKLNILYVNRMNTSDKIPPYLSNLTKLTIFSIARNSIRGQIPSSFMNLTQLSLIDFQRNQLQGPISSSFGRFKSLQSLSLDNNQFNGSVRLDTFLGLNKLKRLFLSVNRISLVASNNYTNGSQLELENLGLSWCRLKEFPAFLRFQNKIKSLFLDHNEIEGIIPVWIWNNSRETLEIFDLAHNFITGFHQHPDFLPWVRLEAFDMTNNQLHGWLPIPPKTTIFYGVSNNNLSGEIPSSICQLKSLRLLDLSSNNMNGTLPRCLSSLSNLLSILDLKRNNFHGTMMNTFVHGSQMKRIDLSENQFTGQVSRSLTNCTNLEVLSLGDNFFDDTFPFWLGNLEKLQVLILRSNKFHGEIQGPTAVGSQFPKLRIIDLSNNSFSGQLPERYFQTWNAMKSVYVGKSSDLNLDIDFSRFDNIFKYSMTITNKGVKTDYGRILDIFTVIDLSCNNFEGQIPYTLQDLQGLQSLNLSNNRLIGRVLPSLGNLTNLESMDLSRNNLSGEIPQQLLQLGFLAVLNLSFNHLDGRIPQGKQFNTFENNSYMGNLGLCGRPLSKECQDSKVSTPPPKSNNFESLLPSERVDWIVISCGVGGGLVIGILLGNFVYARYSGWFSEQFETKKTRWIRSLPKTRRSQDLL